MNDFTAGVDFSENEVESHSLILFKQPRHLFMFGFIHRFCTAACETALPVVVVHVLAYEGVRLHRAICIYFRHVHVVYEVDQSSAARWSIVAPCFLLKGLFQHSYEGDGWKSREH